MFWNFRADHTPLDLEGPVPHLDDGWPLAVSRTVFQVELHGAARLARTLHDNRRRMAALVLLRWPRKSPTRWGFVSVHCGEAVVAFAPAGHWGTYRMRHSAGVISSLRIFKEFPLGRGYKWTNVQLIRQLLQPPSYVPAHRPGYWPTNLCRPACKTVPANWVSSIWLVVVGRQKGLVNYILNLMK